MLDWIINNYIEITGAVLGVLFLFFEIKQNWLLWPLGILTSLFYIFIFFQAKFYADMGLQVYYVVISIYGWWYWWRGTSDSDVDLPIVRVPSQLAWVLSAVTLPLFAIIAFVLVRFTDSPVPYWDAFTTALSIVATWMLARKILEQWYLWMIVNAVSLVLYVYKGLYPTVVLFAFYLVLSFLGYSQWKKALDRGEKSDS